MSALLNTNTRLLSTAFGETKASNITRMRAGTKVITFSNSASCELFKNSDINELLGVTDSSNSNTAVFVSNGDFSAVGAGLYGAFYWNGGSDWQVHIASSLSGSMRINYLVVYWGDSFAYEDADN